MHPETKIKKLREFYEFDDADLAANRAGQLTEKQLKVIGSVQTAKRTMATAAAALSTGLGVLLVLVSCCVFGSLTLPIIFDGHPAKLALSTTLSLVALVVFTLIFLIGGVALFFYSRRKVGLNYILTKVGGPVDVSFQTINTDHGRS